MTIRQVLRGDIFQSDAQTIVNTVNTVGVMGKGVALGFKKRYPEMFADYRERCSRGEVRLGEPYLFRRPQPPWIINFPTKGHWRSPSKLADIEAGLGYLVDHLAEWGVESLALPPLGCGNGELEWRVVGPLMFEYLDPVDIPVDLYAPFETPMMQLDPSFLTAQLELIHSDEPTPEFKVTPAMVALVEVLARVERKPLGPAIGRTSFQKLAYFATEAGIPTGLSFERGPYGPFSAGVKAVTRRLMNNALIDEQPLGQMTAVRVGSAYSRARGNFANEFDSWREPLDRLVDLFSRMTTRDAEIAATVHFAAKELAHSRDEISELDLFAYVEEWKPEKFSEVDIAATIRNLALLGWLDVRASRALPLPDAARSASV